MALIDLLCGACGTVSEVYRAAADWPAVPPCPKCGATNTCQTHRPKAATTYAPAVVVYEAPDGTFRFPGDPHGAVTHQYEQQGYRRIEARGWAEVRSLESRVNAQQGTEIRQRVERQQAQFEQGERLRRSDVHHGLHHGFVLPETDDEGRPTGRLKTVRLSAFGQDALRVAIARGNARRRFVARDAGFHVDAYSYDRSNRDTPRGSDGRRQRD